MNSIRFPDLGNKLSSIIKHFGLQSFSSDSLAIGYSMDTDPSF